jgi:hypothetical protein
VLSLKNLIVVQFAAVGVSLLLHSNVESTERICALFFMVFSAFKLTEISLKIGQRRNSERLGDVDAAPLFDRKIKLDETETVVLELQEGQNGAEVTNVPHWPIIRDFNHCMNAFSRPFLFADMQSKPCLLCCVFRASCQEWVKVLPQADRLESLPTT